jgi:hypothetical protein
MQIWQCKGNGLRRNSISDVIYISGIVPSPCAGTLDVSLTLQMGAAAMHGEHVHRVPMGGAAVGMLLLGVALDRVPRVRAYTLLLATRSAHALLFVSPPPSAPGAAVLFAPLAAQVRGLDGQFDRAR